MSTAPPFVRLWRWLTPNTRLNPASGRWIGLLGRLFPPREARHPFDLAHHVDTGGLIYADGLSTGHQHDIHSSGYYATAPSLFRGAIEHWSATLEASPFRLADYAFVDIGCGKGRVMLLASEYAFREVIGIELNPQLASTARRNLHRWMRRKRWVPLVSRFWRPGILRPGKPIPRVRILEGDALSTPLPDGPVLLFFFNSFEEEMVRLWLDSLVEAAATRSAPIDVIYLHPEHHKLFLETPGMEILAQVDIPLSPGDAAADAFGVSFDRCAIYRLIEPLLA
jgi:SAM-dependent methyltransferase